MAKIIRKNQKIFGASAASGDIRQFASLAEGVPLTTTDPETIQALTRYLQGWRQAITGDDVPALEDFNALHYLQTYQLGYLMQAGIPEYNADTVYYINSYCQEAGIIYVSITDTNTGNLPSTDGGTNWVRGVNSDILSADGTKILDAGTDGTDAEFTGTSMGTMKRIYENNITVAATSVTISGLTSAKFYNLKFLMTGLDGEFFIRFNGVSTGNVYNYSRVKTVNSISTPTSLTGANEIPLGSIGSVTGLDGLYGDFDILGLSAVGRQIVGQASGKNSGGANEFSLFSLGGFAFSPTCTSITIFSTTANAIGIGSTIELYERT